MLQHLSYIPKLIEDFERLLGKPQTTSVVAGVSGGLDSMVLLFLLHHLGYKISIVHVNYKTRGIDSEKDQILVESAAKKFGLQCYVFDGGKVKWMDGNFQKNARDFRYERMNEIRTSINGDLIVTAHHFDDDLETYLFKVIRNSYLFIPNGISEVNGFIRRPLLTLRKSQLLELAQGFGVEWREDSSNQSLDYARNVIRNNVLPEIERIQSIPFDKIKLKNEQLTSFLEEKIAQEVKGYKKIHEDTIRVSQTIVDHPHQDLLLDYIFRYTEFVGRTEEVKRLFHSENGKVLLSASQIIFKEREGICFMMKSSNSEEYLEIIPPFENSQLRILVEEYDGSIQGGPRIAYLDADKLTFPLVWRTTREGDSMRPLGMDGRKKVSDILIGQKRERVDKERARVLLSEEEIAWLSGYRVSEHFKVTEQTKKVLIISLK